MAGLDGALLMAVRVWSKAKADLWTAVGGDSGWEDLGEFLLRTSGMTSEDRGMLDGALLAPACGVHCARGIKWCTGARARVSWPLQPTLTSAGMGT